MWVTQGGVFEEDVTLARLGVHKPHEHESSRQVLVASGVPESAIHMLPERNINTAEEMRSVARRLRAAGGGCVILVTSKFHTRRVQVVWRLVAEGAGEAIVRYTPDDPFDPARWWQNTRDSMAVAREWFGIVNAVLGFPVSSARG